MAQTKAEKEAAQEALKAKLQAFLDDVGGDIQHEAPEGFLKQSGDVVGMWVRCSPIMGIPRSAKLMDSNMDEKKSAALVLFELTKPCVVDVEGEFKIADKGEVVGVWYKPGMRALRWLRDVEVYMKETGEKDIGKGNPMITFDVLAKQKGQPMLVLEDYRETSAPFVDGNGRTVGTHDLEPAGTTLAKVPI